MKTTTLIVGASGATGKLLVEQLLNQEHYVKVIVRNIENLPEFMKDNERVTLICASVLDLSDAELEQHVKGCSAVASCLGHNITWKGIYGKPKRLVTDATSRLCKATIATKPNRPIKYILMNTNGNHNAESDKPISLAQKMVLALIRLLLPPHVDNEMAADYLQTNIGKNHKAIEWAVVRPTTLTNEQQVTEYQVHPSPITSALFGNGKVSRINVAHFMANLISNDAIWQKWKNKMPVIHNLIN